MEDSTDKLARAYSTLKALKDNLPANRVVDSDLVAVYYPTAAGTAQLNYWAP